MYLVDNEMVDDLRRITREYVKYHPKLEDSVLVEDLEELVEAPLQEVNQNQTLNQLDLASPYYSPFQTPVQSQPHSPLRIMDDVNAK